MLDFLRISSFYTTDTRIDSMKRVGIFFEILLKICKKFFVLFVASEEDFFRGLD